MTSSTQQRLIEQLGLRTLRSLAIVGLGKDAGKTTALNHIMRAAEQMSPHRPLAITSIGRDGEQEDIVTGHAKPRVYMKKNQLIATARRSIARGDALLEVLVLSGIRTAEGEVAILRARSNGFVELSGPSVASDIRRCESLSRQYDPDCLLLVDGALSRTSSAGGGLTESVVLVAGMANAKTIDELVEKISRQVEYFTLPALDEAQRKQCTAIYDYNAKARAVIFDDKKTVRRIMEAPALVGHEEAIAKALKSGDRVLALRGALSTRVVSTLLESEQLEKMTLVAEDGTRVFFDEKTRRTLKQREVALRVLSPLHLPMVFVNPTRSDKTVVDVDLLFDQVSSAITIPVVHLGASDWS